MMETFCYKKEDLRADVDLLLEFEAAMQKSQVKRTCELSGNANSDFSETDRQISPLVGVQLESSGMTKEESESINENLVSYTKYCNFLNRIEIKSEDNCGQNHKGVVNDYDKQNHNSLMDANFCSSLKNLSNSFASCEHLTDNMYLSHIDRGDSLKKNSIDSLISNPKHLCSNVNDQLDNNPQSLCSNSHGLLDRNSEPLCSNFHDPLGSNLKSLCRSSFDPLPNNSDPSCSNSHDPLPSSSDPFCSNSHDPLPSSSDPLCSNSHDPLSYCFEPSNKNSCDSSSTKEHGNTQSICCDPVTVILKCEPEDCYENPYNGAFVNESQHEMETYSPTWNMEDSVEPGDGNATSNKEGTVVVKAESICKMEKENLNIKDTVNVAHSRPYSIEYATTDFKVGAAVLPNSSVQNDRNHSSATQLDTAILSVTKEQAFHCDRCLKTFIGRIAFDKHFIDEHGHADAYRKCHLCGKFYSSPRKLYFHICTVHVKSLKEQFNLQVAPTPMEVDQKTKSNSCVICEKSYVGFRSLSEHFFFRHLGQGGATCEYCSLKVANNFILRDHQSRVHFTERPHSCAICSKNFAKELHLRRHVREYHANGNTERVQCSECNKTFDKKRNLLNHIRFVHRECLQMDLCHYCGKLLSRKRFPRHINTNHIKSYKCDECGKKFFTAQVMKEHILGVHLKKKIYKCEVCKKEIVSQSNLAKHMKTMHLKTQLYKCPLCDKSFAEKSNLTKHVPRVHRVLSSITHSSTACK